MFGFNPLSSSPISGLINNIVVCYVSPWPRVMELQAGQSEIDDSNMMPKRRFTPMVSGPSYIVIMILN